jgi:ribosomal protein L18
MFDMRFTHRSLFELGHGTEGRERLAHGVRTRLAVVRASSANTFVQIIRLQKRGVVIVVDLQERYQRH